MKKLGIIGLSLLFFINALAISPRESNFQTLPFNKKVTPGLVIWQRDRARPLTPRQLTRKLPPIDSIYIKGGVNLKLQGGRGCSINVKKLYPGLYAKVCGRILYIGNSRPVDCNQYPRPDITVTVTTLRQLVVAGNSCVCGQGFDTSCGLCIDHCGSGSVCLYGLIYLCSINSSGFGQITIPSVSSHEINIVATRQSCIKLTGFADLLQVRAFQHAVVDTRFLRSESALVQAADDALVTVRTIGDLRAFAGGQSNVYYYTKPYNLLQHTRLSGNVLQMGCCY